MTGIGFWNLPANESVAYSRHFFMDIASVCNGLISRVAPLCANPVGYAAGVSRLEVDAFFLFNFIFLVLCPHLFLAWEVFSQVQATYDLTSGC